MNITEFLKARIDEDETKARQLQADLLNQIQAEQLGPDENGPYTPARLLKSSLWAQYDGQTRWRNFARGQQIAYLANPARALAECAAKRAIIKDASTYVDEYENESWRTNDDLTAGRVASRARFWREELLRHLATIYADHPDYQEEWRP